MARNRTEAKLRYAGVHLTELVGTRRAGSDFDVAHQESFLFHLFGVRDSLLQEINIAHSCEIPIEKVSRPRIEKALNACESSSPALDEIRVLEDDPDSWLSCAAEMRHHSAHRTDVSRTYYKGGANNGAVHLHDVRIGQEINVDFVDLFGQWLDNMGQLVERVRSKMPGAEDA